MTFMILGNVCTRNCCFCAVEPGSPFTVDPEEPQRVAQAVQKLGLSYVVITSVTRDDLSDGGASRFAETIRAIRNSSFVLRPSSLVPRIEVLIPDFQGNIQALQTVLDAEPDVLNHNIETVPRLYSEVRPEADYQRSLSVLENAKLLKKNIATKSGLMVGFGETEDEIISVLKDLKRVNCDYITLGQYLAPSKNHYPVKEYIHPDQFKKYEEIGLKLGLKKIFSGPFVRSSYMAEEVYATS
jgi:lipoic acid synthetase